MDFGGLQLKSFCLSGFVDMFLSLNTIQYIDLIVT